VPAPAPALELEWLDGDYAVWQLEAGAPAPTPGEEGTGRLMSVTRTAHEVSVVGPEHRAPAGVPVSRGWSAFRVGGELDHSLVGVLSSLAGALAAAAVPIFAISTFDTDYLLVPAASRGEAAAALREAGHRIG
jgi:hypothetical protein